MKLWSRHLILALTAGTVVWLIGTALTGHASAQAGKDAPKAGKAAPATVKGTVKGTPANASAYPPTTGPNRPPAGVFFKNVSTSTLKGLSVDDFMGAMGVMAAALGFDCSDCHPGAGSDKVDWVFDTPKKITARKMTEMVATINRNNFGGTDAGKVTCWTCHHGREVPATTIALDKLYGAPNDEKDDVILQAPEVPTATQILDKYIAAVGGAAKVNTLKSFIATGTSVGYERLGGGGTFEIYAKAPEMHVTQIVFKDRPERGDSTRSYNGKTGFIKTPRSLLGEYELSGGELSGARLDAMLCFPGEIKQALTNWRSGYSDVIGDTDVEVVQGNGPNGLLATLYFNQKTGLLVRMVRYTNSPIGHVSTQTDYSDYRDVGGIKFPFQYTFSWLDGKDQFQLSKVQVNAPIDDSKFGKP